MKERGAFRIVDPPSRPLTLEETARKYSVSGATLQKVARFFGLSVPARSRAKSSRAVRYKRKAAKRA